MSHSFAPWVLSSKDGATGKFRLLGPGLSLIEADEVFEPDEITNDALLELQSLGFLDDEDEWLTSTLLPRSSHTSRLESSEKLCIRSLNGEYSREIKFLGDALKEEAPSLSICCECKGNRECINNAVLIYITPFEYLASDAPSSLPILWFGECKEGLHIGPMVSTADEYGSYIKSSRLWSLDVLLHEYGFCGIRPLSLIREIRRDSHRVARGIILALNLPWGSCFLLNHGTVREIWFTRTKKFNGRLEFEKQFWSKGVFSEFQIKHEMDIFYLGSCLTPCLADPVLESNSGKGATREIASITTIGEAIERFSSWQWSNGDINLLEDISNNDSAKFPLYSAEDFHAIPVEYGTTHTKKCRYVFAEDIIEREKVLVPADLIPFPNTTPSRSYMSDTAGLSAFRSRDGAILRSILEVMERNDFYPNFMNLRDGMILRNEDFIKINTKFNCLLSEVQKRAFTPFFLRYEDNECTVYIIHAFVFDEKKKRISRGSGSSWNIILAMKKALLEALQLMTQYENIDKQNNFPQYAAYAAWSSHDAVSTILDYLNAQRTSGTELFKNYNLSLSSLLNSFRRQGNKVLVVDIATPFLGWWVVRVLVPGFTLSQTPSKSKGGAKIEGALFDYPIPN